MTSHLVIQIRSRDPLSRPNLHKFLLTVKFTPLIVPLGEKYRDDLNSNSRLAPDKTEDLTRRDAIGLTKDSSYARPCNRTRSKQMQQKRKGEKGEWFSRNWGMPSKRICSRSQSVKGRLNGRNYPFLGHPLWLFEVTNRARRLAQALVEGCASFSNMIWNERKAKIEFHLKVVAPSAIGSQYC